MPEFAKFKQLENLFKLKILNLLEIRKLKLENLSKHEKLEQIIFVKTKYIVSDKKGKYRTRDGNLSC
jgi:hypothetical protein